MATKRATNMGRKVKEDAGKSGTMIRRRDINGRTANTAMGRKAQEDAGKSGTMIRRKDINGRTVSPGNTTAAAVRSGVNRAQNMAGKPAKAITTGNAGQGKRIVNGNSSTKPASGMEIKQLRRRK